MITLPTAAGATTEYEDFYETTLLNPVTPADTDIYPTVMPSSAVGFLVIDPYGANPEIIFYNTKGSNYVRVPSVTDGEGRGIGNTTPRGYDAGTKIGMYSIAEYFEGLANGRFMRDGFLQSRHFSASIDPNSWIGTGETWNYVGNNGQKEYQYVTAGDKRTKYTPGMKVRMPRVITAPTQCADLEQTSSQYANRAAPSGMTFNDDFTCEAWVKLESYGGGTMTIVSRSDATPANGWALRINNLGQINMAAYNGGAANYRDMSSYQSIPLGVWVHVVATMDMSGWTTATNKIYLNGIEIPIVQATYGTNPTSLVNTGDLAIGRHGSFTGQYFDGEVADVRVWSTQRSQAQVRDNMHKQLVGNEVGLVGYWKLDGNFNDSTANVNHLTGQNGATAVTVDNPFSANEYGIITNVAFSAGNSTISVFTGVRHNAPYENLSSIAYSAVRTPVGFPADESDWWVEALFLQQLSVSAPTPGAWYYVGATPIHFLPVPSGRWIGGYKGGFLVTHSGAAYINVNTTLSTANNAVSDYKMNGGGANGLPTSLGQNGTTETVEAPINNAAMTNYFLILSPTISNSTVYWSGGLANGFVIIRAKCAYV